MQKPKSGIFHMLNAIQKEAVMHTQGPLLILAGAGSGKTKVLTHRIAHIIQNGTPPDRILAVTFTNKAAEEMKKRVTQLLQTTHHPSTGSGSRAKSRDTLSRFREKRNRGSSIANLSGQTNKPWISTFHSLGASILRQEAHNAGLKKSFSILDEEDALSLIKESLKELALDPKQFQPTRIRAIISQKKGELVDCAAFQEEAGEHYFPRMLSHIWERYEEKLSSHNAVDFDDLLLKTVTLFRENPSILSRWQRVWAYIHIDEYQDTNHAQYVLANLLAHAHKNICVVGDGDQCIYSWRGADFRNIFSFERDWPKARLIALEENYRSTSVILDAANAIIAKNTMRKEKNLFTQKGGGGKIALVHATHEGEEARLVMQKIQKLITKGAPKKEIAILMRTNFQSRIFEEAFLKSRIPYRITGVKFFNRKEIKDTLAYVRAARNTDDWVSKKRIINTPARGIGKTLLLKITSGSTLKPAEKEKYQSFRAILTEIAKKTEALPPSKIIRHVLRHTGYWELWDPATEEGAMRIANLEEIVTLATRYDAQPPPSGIEMLLEDAALMSEQDNIEKKADAVHIMTIHGAKGLEFDHVFVVGLEDGLFPHATLAHEDAQAREEEERRLFYVALTRARKKLFLSYALFRTVFGEKRVNAPSRFLADVPSHLVETYNRNDEEDIIKY